MNKLLFVILAAAVCTTTALSAETSVEGKWQLEMDSPHGRVHGPLEVKQDGSKLKCTYTVENLGTFELTGEVQDKKVALDLHVPAGDTTIRLSGDVDGDKMGGTSDHGGSWAATRMGAAQKSSGEQKAILGTVTGFRIASLEFAVKPDDGKATFVKCGPQTQVIRVPPGERDLEKGQPAQLTDVAIGDRILVSYVSGLSDARRIVLVAAGDIARRNEAARLDWQRGVSGVVVAKSGGEITLQAPAGTVTVTGKTKVRRYAPDSVRFADAERSSVDEIAVGDQLQARGNKSADGANLAAEEIVFGTFLTKIGAVKEVDSDGRWIRVEDLTTKTPLTVKLTADSRIRKLPDVHQMMEKMTQEAHGGSAEGQTPGRAEIGKMMEQLPLCSVDDLKPGGTVIITSTRGRNPVEVTAIRVLANVDSLIQMAMAHGGAPTENPLDAINRMHGGLFSGPGGVSLPAILQ